MKRFIFAVVIAASTVPALAADVAVSITAGQPGYDGRIDIGNFPQPQLCERAQLCARQLIGSVFVSAAL